MVFFPQIYTSLFKKQNEHKTWLRESWLFSESVFILKYWLLSLAFSHSVPLAVQLNHCSSEISIKTVEYLYYSVIQKVVYGFKSLLTKSYLEEVCKSTLKFLRKKQNKTIVTHSDFCKYDGLYLRKALLGIK